MKKSFYFIFVLFLALFSGCQNEEVSLDELSINERAQSWYEQNHSLKLDENPSFYGKPDWNNGIRVNNELHFPLIRESKVKSGVSSRTNETFDEEHSVYAKSFLVLTEDEENEYEETLKVYVNTDSENLETNEEAMTSAFVRYDNNNRFIRYEFKEGESINIQVGFPSSGNSTSRMPDDLGGCTTIGVFMTTTYTDGTSETILLYTYEVCPVSLAEADSDDSNGGGNGGSDEDDADLFYPDCSSWEYANRTVAGGFIKIAAVSGFHDEFYGAANAGQGAYITGVQINFPTLYFTTPTGWTNGHASTVTAYAMQAAIETTRAFFRANPLTHQLVMEQLFYQNMRIQMQALGGSVSTINTHGMTNPAPYLITSDEFKTCY